MNEPTGDRRRRLWGLAAVAVAAFVAAFLIELKVIGFGENLTSTARGGSLMEDGLLTAYGWWSLSWRAGIATVLAVLLVVAVWLAVRRLRRRGD